MWSQDGMNATSCRKWPNSTRSGVHIVLRTHFWPMCHPGCLIGFWRESNLRSLHWSSPKQRIQNLGRFDQYTLKYYFFAVKWTVYLEPSDRSNIQIYIIDTKQQVTDFTLLLRYNKQAHLSKLKTVT